MFSPRFIIGSLKIVSWNVNGIRAWLPKGGLEYLRDEDPDVFCVQETKCADDKLPKELESLSGYKRYFLAGDKDGYSGVGVLSKVEPIKITYGINVKEHDNEGRVITMEFEDFYLVNAYVPNAGRGLVRLEYRMRWDKDFRLVCVLDFFFLYIYKEIDIDICIYIWMFLDICTCMV